MSHEPRATSHKPLPTNHKPQPQTKNHQPSLDSHRTRSLSLLELLEYFHSHNTNKPASPQTLKINIRPDFSLLIVCPRQTNNNNNNNKKIMWFEPGKKKRQAINFEISSPSSYSYTVICPVLIVSLPRRKGRQILGIGKQKQKKSRAIFHFKKFLFFKIKYSSRSKTPIQESVLMKAEGFEKKAYYLKNNDVSQHSQRGSQEKEQKEEEAEEAEVKEEEEEEGVKEEEDEEEEGEEQREKEDTDDN
ncbi:hypothetical protein PoB_001304700 [Plakobranchus ocellatus]|uniref:Uncharacterized protein n=1 Tax=Plakobranchus ocellatus TaxID=259542 RepID=A0AAV3YWJ5_9GAST|nr:hypothetical protein PoB_001304700 [Plakobranchus ocellatus]